MCILLSRVQNKTSTDARLEFVKDFKFSGNCKSSGTYSTHLGMGVIWPSVTTLIRTSEDCARSARVYSRSAPDYVLLMQTPGSKRDDSGGWVPAVHRGGQEGGPGVQTQPGLTGADL